MQMALDVLHHHNGVINHKSHGKHDGEQREQVDGKSRNPSGRPRQSATAGLHFTGISTARNDPRNKNMTTTTIKQRLGQRVQHFVDGVLNVGGRVAGTPIFMPCGNCA